MGALDATRRDAFAGIAAAAPIAFFGASPAFAAEKTAAPAKGTAKASTGTAAPAKTAEKKKLPPLPPVKLRLPRPLIKTKLLPHLRKLLIRKKLPLPRPQTKTVKKQRPKPRQI